MKKYRSFTNEFKRNLVGRIERGEVTRMQVAREAGLSPSLVDKWRKQIREGTFRDRPTSREKELERDLDRYKKKVGELTMELDLLKKINESFASMRRSNGSVVTPENTAVSGGPVK